MKEFSSENTLILRNQLADDIVRDKEAVFRNAKGRFLLAGRNKQALGMGFLQGAGADDGLEFRGIYACCGAQAQHYALYRGVIIRELLTVGRPAAVGLHFAIPAAAAGTVKGMCSGAKANVRSAAPVSAVMHGLMAWKGKVRDLVMIISGLAQAGAKVIVLTAALLLGGLCEPSVCNHFLQGAAFLYGKLIGGYVLWMKLQGLIQSLFPYTILQLRQAKDKVNADIVYPAGADGFNGVHGSIGSMATVHPSQDTIVKGLDAKADAVGPDATEFCNQLRSDVVRIHLYRELTEGVAGREGQGLHYPADTTWRQHRWGTAAKV